MRRLGNKLHIQLNDCFDVSFISNNEIAWIIYDQSGSRYFFEINATKQDIIYYVVPVKTTVESLST